MDDIQVIQATDIAQKILAENSTHTLTWGQVRLLCHEVIRMDANEKIIFQKEKGKIMDDYASEIGYGEKSIEELEYEERLDRVRTLLPSISLAHFSASDVYHIFMVMNRYEEHSHRIKPSLEKLEKMLYLELANDR